MTQLPPAVAQTESPSPSPATDTPQVPPTQTPIPPGLSQEQRIANLEERLNLALELKDERIQSINERSENTYKLLQIVSVIAGAILLIFSIRDTILRSGERQRQRGIDEIVKDMMNLQKAAVEQQVRFGEMHLDRLEANPRQQMDEIAKDMMNLQKAAVEQQVRLGEMHLDRLEANPRQQIDEITKDMLNLQKAAVEQQVQLGQLHLSQVEKSPAQQFDAVKNVNDVIGVVRQTLAFRLEQEEKVAEALAEIERIKAERERVKKQKLTQAIAILDHFKAISRMELATLTEEQYKRGIRLQGLANDLANNLGEFLSEQGFEVAGSLLYTCGVIAYYDNNVIEAKDYLDRAAQCLAQNHDGELATNQRYLNRFAFIYYFRALIQKNWGELSVAQYEIEQSAKLLKDRESEFLTPVTKAEILSYIVGDEKRCRDELERLLQRINDLEAGLNSDGKKLDSNQIRLRNRMLILWGNTHFEQKEFKDALAQYLKAIEFKSDDYYALTSAAQCEKELGDEPAATAHFRQGLDAIERSRDLRTKRERITRAVIAVIAANAAKGCDDKKRQEQYSQEARELLSGNLTVEGMSPQFFSPATKRLASAKELLELLKELES